MKLCRWHCLTGAAIAAVALIAGPDMHAASARSRARAKAVPASASAAPAPTTLVNTSAGPIAIEAQHALVIEAETGTTLLDKGADERIPPASMSKIMTAYIVFSMLKSGRAKLTDELPVSKVAWRTGGSKMFVPVGGHVSIDDLLQGMIVQSGNDACVVLAQGLAGSQQAFVDIMNATAKKLGLTHSHFADVDGLPNPDHYMSVRDLATLAIDIIHQFPEYYHYFGQKEFTFDNIKQGNRNPLLYANIGADGVKTGHTEAAGYSLLASIHRGNRRVIIVFNGLPTSRARAQEGELLAEWAFREYKNYRLFKAGATVDTAPVWMGVEPKVPLTVRKDVIVTLSRKARKGMKVSLDYNSPLPAPVHAGKDVGKLVVSAPDTKPVAVPLYAAADVARLGPFGRAATVAAQLIWGNRH